MLTINDDDYDGDIVRMMQIWCALSFYNCVVTEKNPITFSVVILQIMKCPLTLTTIKCHFKTPIAKKMAKKTLGETFLPHPVGFEFKATSVI